MPDWRSYVRERLPRLGVRAEREAEIVEELAQQLEQAYSEAQARGLSEQEAVAAVTRQISDWGKLAQEIRLAEQPLTGRLPEQARAAIQEPVVPGKERGNMWADLWQDTRYGVRVLLKSPMFTLVAVLTLALGIGANTAIFSVVNAVLLRPLPYEDPDRLVHLWTTHRRQAFERSELAYPNYLDLRAENRVFADMAGYNGTSFTLTGRGIPERVPAERVSASFFPTLGVKPHLGRFFTAEEEPEGTERVVVLSYGAWQRRFGADPGILGQTLTLTGRPYTVIGVLPPGFHFARARMAELWTPLYTTENQRTRRNFYWFNTVARLKPGVTIEQAQAEMDGLSNQQVAAHPETNSGTGIAVVPLRKEFLGETREAVLLLMVSVGFLLLIGCVNLANLLLARAASREKEMAVRASLGASRARLVRQVLAETTLLALAGGVTGALVARWGVTLLLGAVPERVLVRAPSLMGTQVDGPVLVFTLAVSLLTGFLFGMAPALRASRVNLQNCLKEGGRTTAGSGRSVLRNALVTAEVALALMLAVGTGLFLRSLWRVAGADPGFQKENILIFRVSIPSVRYPEVPDIVRFFRELRGRLETLPGVREVAVTSNAPLTGDGGTVYIKEEGQPDPRPGEELETVARDAGPNYFAMMGVPLRAGRYFAESDDAGAPQVAILSETLAKRMFPGENPVGRSIHVIVSRSAWRVVGVVGDVSLASVDTRIRPVLYTCNLQDPSRSTDVIVRSAVEPASLIGSIRKEVSGLDPEVAVFGVATMEETQMNAESVFQRRALATLLGIFAGLAVLLAAVGVYGVMSYAVSQRGHEMGIRMALGAQRADIFRLVISEGIALTLLGVGIGTGAAFGLTRFLQSLLYGVEPTDPATFALVPAALLVVALAACWIPASRATKVDPMVALRYE